MDTTDTTDLTGMEPLQRLSRDIKAAAVTLTDKEARYLVDHYYMMQEDRKRSKNQERALESSEEPHGVISWFGAQSSLMEKSIAGVLDVYSNSKKIGVWARSICGIGPIISAGLMAHISMRPWRCRNTEAKKSCRPQEPCQPDCNFEIIETVGHIWRYAGLDPTSVWEAEKKRPWNASLKTLCWKIGESFVKVSNKEDDIYGKIYVKRKDYEAVKNEAGEYAEQAAAILKKVPNHKQKDIYKTGKLPPGHLHSRAKRYAVKLFLSHWHEVAYTDYYGKPPPLPYPIAFLGHAHIIEAPNKYIVS